MTEEEYLECVDPDRMLAYLEGIASTRKLCLLSAACCRRAWHLLETDHLRQAVEALERFADGAIDEEAFRAFGSTTHPLMNYREEIFSGQPRTDVMCASYAVNAVTRPLPGYGYRKGLDLLAYSAGPCNDVERAAQINLIREVFGNPFRPAAVHSTCLRWAGDIILNLARVAYDERSLPTGALDGVRLQILADALEEAGCADANILTHLRSPGPHVRGCWALDCLLDKH
jgi:hypothetical protein